MPLQQADRDSLERPRGRGDLGQDVDAVRILVHHPVQAPYLPFDAAQPAQQGLLVGSVSGHDAIVPPWGIKRRIRAAGCLVVPGVPASPRSRPAPRAAGVTLPHSSTLQWAQVAHVTRVQLQPGDLVFYYGNIHHVAIYIGADRIIHAPTYGEEVTIAPIDNAPVHGYGRP
jgi:hypothetical protein